MAWSPKRRMEAAQQRVIDDGLSISEAARIFGVSRPRLSERVNEYRNAIVEQQERSAAAREERALSPTAAPGERLELAPGEDPVPTLTVSREARRVPPFPEFWQTYLSNTECPDCGVCHPLPGFHNELMDVVTSPAIKRVLCNVPPYHAKSSVVTVWSTVYELCRDPNSRTMIISKGSRLAERFLYSIMKYLSDPAIYDGAARNLIDDWGPFQGDGQWSGKQLYVAGRQGAEKDPSVSAYGFGTAIYGTRADRIIFDDVADLENQKNPERVNDMLLWATQEAASRVGKNGKLIFCGTRVSAGDIYSMLQELPGYHVFRYPAIMDEEAKLTLWPDHFGFESANLMRNSMSHEQWQLVYQNVDTPGIGASFTPEMIDLCRDRERSLGEYDRAWRLIMGVDPAGGGEMAGYTAMVVLGVDSDGRRHLVDLVNVKQMKAPQIMQQIYDWAELYAGSLVEVRAEVNGLQSQLFTYNVELNARLTNRGIRLSPHVTTKYNKLDSQFGVEAMAPMFFNNMITLPYKQQSDRARIRQLEDQLLSFPMGKVSDLVMSLWFAELGVKDLTSRQALPLFDPRFKAPKRILRRRKIIDFGERTVLGAPMDNDQPMGPPPGYRFQNLGPA